ncbi:MAG TPA: oligosaccharide flippase family protein [Allosphingosinicella sp.]|nr:oligosaccharide flippase family protein [Allosphingosinicella sp.]
MTASSAQRLILRGGSSAALGFLIRFGARLLFVFVAGRLFGAALFGAYAIAVAVVELAVTIGGAGLKRQVFKLLDEEPDGRTPPHILIDGMILVLAASSACAVPIMLVVTFLPDALVPENSDAALFLLAPMIVGQALLDLLLAATRWTHKMRHQVWARSIIEPYAGVAAIVLAWAAGYRETGLIIGYWAGTWAALAYALASARQCLGPFRVRGYRFVPARLVRMVRETALPTLSDFTNALAGRLDLYLVGLLLGEAPAGIYGMAQQVRTPIRQVRQSFDGLLTPIVSRTLKHGGAARTGRATASASRLILAIQLPALVALAIIGAPLLRLIGPEFVAGYWAMLLLASAESIQGAFGVSDLIFFYRRPQMVIFITMVSASVNVVAGWLLIARYGIAGGALAALLAAAGAAIARRALLRAMFGVAVPLRYVAAPLSAAAANLGVALIILALPLDSAALRLGLAFLFGLAVYAAVLKGALWATGQNLSLTHFVVEDPRAAPAP